MKNPDRKPRFITLEARFGDKTVPDRLHFTPKTGEVRFSSSGATVSPLECSIDFSYSRTRKEKSVRRYPVSPSDIKLHPDYAIYNADTVYVVDTNTKDDLSVTCVLRGNPVFSEDGVKKGIRFRSCPYLVYKGLQESPERAAWREVILREYSEKDGETRMIVDSALNRLTAFNTRSEPIFDDFFLPDGVQLIYASADVGKEHMANQVFSQADKGASAMMKKIIAGEVSVP